MNKESASGFFPDPDSGDPKGPDPQHWSGQGRSLLFSLVETETPDYSIDLKPSLIVHTLTMSFTCLKTYNCDVHLKLKDVTAFVLKHKHRRYFDIKVPRRTT